MTSQTLTNAAHITLTTTPQTTQFSPTLEALAAIVTTGAAMLAAICMPLLFLRRREVSANEEVNIDTLDGWNQSLLAAPGYKK